MLEIDKELTADVAFRAANLRELNRDAKRTGAGVDKRYHYICQAYAYAWECANNACPRDYMRALGGDPSKHDVPAFIHAILAATSRDKRRQLWKYASSLKLAAMKNKGPKTVKAFIQKNGGFNACAAKYTKAQAKASAPW